MRNSSADDILISQFILVIVATALVVARLNLRLRVQKRKLLLSDIFMVGAWVSGAITAAFGPAFAILDAFNPNVRTTLEGYQKSNGNLVVILKLLFATSFPFYSTFYLCKAALLAVYLQVFPEFMVKRRKFLWVTIWFVLISYIVTIVLLFVICLPIDRSWDLKPSRTCPKWTYVVTFHVGWGLSFIGDILVFILPWLIVPGLNVRRSLKLGIYFTFLLGTINIAVSLVRFVMIFKAAADSSISLSTIVFWSTLDMNIGLVIACLPSLRPYFGARSNSQQPSQESRTWESTLKPYGLGTRTVCYRAGGRDEEAWPPSSSNGRNMRFSSIADTVVGSWDEGKGQNSEASDVELTQMSVPPEVRMREIKYGR